MNEKFEKNQNNPELKEIRVLWTGHSVALYVAPDLNRILACGIPANGKLVQFIKDYCVLNNYRCNQIKGNQIHI
jgi:hypothetical protein